MNSLSDQSNVDKINPPDGGPSGQSQEASQELAVDREWPKDAPQDGECISTGSEVAGVANDKAAAPPPEPVALDRLLDEMRATLERHISLPLWAAEATALWTVFSHAIDCFHHSPRLAVISPTENCGKSTFLKALSRLCPKPLLTSNISKAAIFRIVEKERPTLLIDEADTFISEDHIGILNSGHDRETAIVVRTEQPSNGAYQPVGFRTWCPMVIAKIGEIEPPSLRSRCILIRMKRAKPHERPQPLTPPNDPIWEDLRDRTARWVQQNVEKLSAAQPLVDGLDSRAADNFRPLFAIADLAGEIWSKRAREAAAALVEVRKPSVAEELLAAIERAFDREGELRSEELCEALGSDEDFEGASAFGFIKNARAAGRHLNKELAPFGIRAGSWSDGQGGSWRGFKAEQFRDAWERYLKPS